MVDGEKPGADSTDFKAAYGKEWSAIAMLTLILAIGPRCAGVKVSSSSPELSSAISELGAVWLLHLSLFFPNL